MTSNPSSFEELAALQGTVIIPASLFTVDEKGVASASREKIEAHLLSEYYKEKKDECELIEQYGNLENGSVLPISACKPDTHGGKPCLSITRREVQLVVAKERKREEEQKAWQEKRNKKSWLRKFFE